MDRIADAVIVLVMCVPLSLYACPAEHAVAYLLVAVISGCILLMEVPRAAQMAIAVLFAFGCAVMPGMYSLAPFAAYICMCRRSWIVRFLWLIPLCVGVTAADWRMSMGITVLSAISSVLAVRTVRGELERKGMRAVRDGLREQAIGLADANRHLREELESEAAGGDACDIRPGEGRVAAEGSGIAGVACMGGEDSAAYMRGDAFADLTDREQAVVELIAEGLDNRQIAGSLYLSEGTVRNHISTILQKKQLKNRTQIAIMYYRG